MLVSEIKPITKARKDLLKDKNPEGIIEIIIEKPLQRACKECREKNIETLMSSGNKNNIAKNSKKIVNKAEVIEKSKKHKLQTFFQAGKGYAWLMLNFKTLSDENKKILFLLEKEYGEETVWFVESLNIYVKNFIRKFLKLKEIDEDLNDEYDKLYKEKRILLMISGVLYPRRNVFIRMPINEQTTVEEVEVYFDKFISRLLKHILYIKYKQFDYLMFLCYNISEAFKCFNFFKRRTFYGKGSE